MAHENETGALASNVAAAPAEFLKSLSSGTARIDVTEATMSAAENGEPFREGDSRRVGEPGVDVSEIPGSENSGASHSMPAPSAVLEPTDERVPERREQQDRRPSQISLTTLELWERELPPLPDPFPDTTPVAPKSGIPLPISTSRRQQERPERPQTPSASTRTPPRNAATSVSTARRTMSFNNTQPSLPSMVLVVQALESILSAKETKRRKPLADSVQRALDTITSAAPETPPDAAVIFESLQVACSVQKTPITITALDCIGKLILAG